MKVYNSIGSKERFLEMFKRVNKLQINEVATNIMQTGTQLVEKAFNELKSGEANVKQTNTQNDNGENFVEIIAVDNEGNQMTFRFKLNSSESDQDDVYNVSDAVLSELKIQSSKINIDLPENMKAIQEFNAAHAGEIMDVVSEYANFETNSIDAELEEAIKFIDKIPYNKGTEDMQTNSAYADQKPTNPTLRVKSPELDKFVSENDEYLDDDYTQDTGEEDVLALPPDYNPADLPQDNDDDGSKGIDPYEENQFDAEASETSPEEQEIYSQAYDNLIAAGNQTPTSSQIDAEVLRLKRECGVEKPFEKKRAISKEAEPFYENNMKINADKLVAYGFENIISPEMKESMIKLADELLSDKLGVKKLQMSRKEYYQLVKKQAIEFYKQSVSDMNEEETEYPNEIGKKFKPKRQIPKKKKKPQSVVKLSESVDDSNREHVIDYYTFMFQDEHIKNSPILQQELAQYFPMSREELSQLSNDELQHIWDVVANADNEVNEQSEGADEFFPITTPLGSQDDKLFVSVVNQGIDSHLKGFTESKFGTENGRRVFKFHVSELPILLKRLEEIGTEEALSWKEDIENYDNSMDEQSEVPKEYWGYPEDVMVENNGGDIESEPESEDIDTMIVDKEETGDVIAGGLADDKSPDEYDKDQLALGLKVELEHTDNPMIALEIAMDHLAEDPEYYTRKEDPEASAQDGAAKDAEGSEEETTDELLGFKPHNVGDYDGSDEHPLADILDSDGTEEDLSKTRTGEKGVNRALPENIVDNNGEYTGEVGDRYQDGEGNQLTVKQKDNNGITLQGQGGEKEIATPDIQFLKKLSETEEQILDDKFKNWNPRIPYGELKNLKPFGNSSFRPTDLRTNVTYFQLDDGFIVADESNYSINGFQPYYGGVIKKNGRLLNRNGDDITDNIRNNANEYSQISDKLKEFIFSNSEITEEQIKMARLALNKRGLKEGMSKKEAIEILIKHNIK